MRLIETLKVVLVLLVAGINLAEARTERLIIGAPGLPPELNKYLVDVEFPNLKVDIREMTTGLDVEYRLYGPGKPHWGSAKFRYQCNDEVTKGLLKFARNGVATGAGAAAGAARIKVFSSGLHMHQRVTQETTVSLRDYEVVDIRQKRDVLEKGDCVTELKLKAKNVKVKSETSPLKGGYECPMKDACEYAEVIMEGGDLDGDGVPDVARAYFDSADGGELLTHLRTNSPGHKSVGEITLRKLLKPDDQDRILEWIREVSKGKDIRKNITVNLRKGGEEKPTKTVTFHECFVTGMQTNGSEQNDNDEAIRPLVEEITVKPMRIELR